SGATVALMSVAGRPLEACLPLVAGYCLRRLRGRHRFNARAHLRGHLVQINADGLVLEVLPPEDRPASLRGLRLLGVEAGDGPLGVISNSQWHTYVGVLRVMGGSFHLLDDAGQAAAIWAWASILSGYAMTSSPVSRLQWIERTLPEDGHQLAQHFRERSSHDAPPAALRVYAEALSKLRQEPTRHERLLALHLGARLARAQSRPSVGSH